MKSRSIICTLTFAFLLIPFAVTSIQADYQSGLNAYRAGDYETAYKVFITEAEQGNADAQYKLGVIYDKAQGVPEDWREAMKWYLKAADLGHAEAQYSLGNMAWTYEGWPKRCLEATGWYFKAAEQGHMQAQYALGKMHHMAGFERDCGLPRDLEQASRWYLKAAEQGHAKAQYSLGLMYDNGWGVMQDDREAAKWVRKAAEQGDDSARKWLALEMGDLVGPGVIFGWIIAILLIVFIFCVLYPMSLGQGNMNWRILVGTMLKKLRIPLSIIFGVLGFLIFYFFGVMYTELEQSRLGPASDIIPIVAGLVGAFIGSKIWWIKSDLKDKNKDMKSD